MSANLSCLSFSINITREKTLFILTELGGAKAVLDVYRTSKAVIQIRRDNRDNLGIIFHLAL